MVASGQNKFVGMDCPVNTYGAAGKVYGLTAAGCKPCSRNLVTDGKLKVNSSEVCTNDDGWGYASEGASRCAPGFYNWKGSRRPCAQCPQFRTTFDDPKLQRNFTDCIVAEGYGIASSASNSTDAYDVDVNSMTLEQLSTLPILECPVGKYGPGGSPAAKCAQCPNGHSTLRPASTLADCTGECHALVVVL